MDVKTAQTAIFTLLLAVPALAQGGQDEELKQYYGKTIAEVKVTGLARSTQPLDAFTGRAGQVFNEQLLTEWRNRLTGTRFEHLEQFSIKAEPRGDLVAITISVVEYLYVREITFRGMYVFEPDELRGTLRVGRHSWLNPYQLKLDKEYLIGQYKEKGYYFAEVQAETLNLGGGEAELVWQVSEGPEVEIDEILFSGDVSVDPDELLDIMSTKESGIFSSPAFVERKLLLDIERLKLYYWLEGWQDIYNGERIFLEGLDFSEDRSEVDIRIHVKEPIRYAVKSIVIEGNTLFPTEKILEWIQLRPGMPASEKITGDSLKTVKNRYAEQAFIMARINHEWVQDDPADAGLLSLRVKIEEGGKVRVGRIDIINNSKTQDEVIRREMRDFAPGEFYNEDKINRGVERLYGSQYFTRGAIKFYHEPGRDEMTRNVKIEVEEGQTGSLRLLGGYSSSFGFLGVVELTQRNFDIVDTPDTFGELLSGDAFVGAGQIFRLRIMPAQRRQSYTAEFREPYLFGEDVGMTLRGFDVITDRSSWREETRGGAVSFDKRWDELIASITFNGFEIEIDQLENDAPRGIIDIEGIRSLISLTPGVSYDTRDSATIPTEGFLGEGAVEFAGGFLPGDFDFYKLDIGAENHWTLYEAEERNKLSRYVISTRVDLGYAQPYGDSDDVPIFRRFFAGGRQSMRGYAFRGMGPHEGDDPIGGKVLAIATLEYSMPFFFDILRVAAFYDVGSVANSVSDLGKDDVGEFRHVVGFGFRVIIPFLGNTPVALDFGFPLNEVDGDDEQLVTFDIGRLF